MPDLPYLSAEDMAKLEFSLGDILAAVERGLVAHWQNRASSEPTISYRPLPDESGLLSIVRGTLKQGSLAMIKTVGTFPENRAQGLPSNPGLVTLLDAATGVPLALVDAASITTMRTAAVTALGAKYLARNDAGILGCIGSRGIALQAVRYIAELLDLKEIRIYSPQKKNCNEAVKSLAESTDCPVVARDNWQQCLDGADIMIDGSSLGCNQTLFPLQTLTPGCTLIAYGYYSSMPAGAFGSFDRLVMDRWVDDECGAFGPEVAAGGISEESVDALIGGVIAGDEVGRKSPDDRLLFWHRGVAACDIALSELMLRRVKVILEVSYD